MKIVALLVIAYIAITALFGIQWFWDKFFYAATIVDFIVRGPPTHVNTGTPYAMTMDQFTNTADYELAVSTKNPELCKDTVPSQLFCAAVITGNPTLCMEPEIFDIGLGTACLKRVCDANPKNNDLACVIARLRH